MGAAKRELERQQDLHGLAQVVADEAGAIKECMGHAGVYVRQYDPDAEKLAYAIGTNRFKDGEVDGSRKEFMAAIKSAIEDSGEECYSCAKNAAD